jgi:ATP-dependent helicase/nuclease subunit B
MGIEFVLGRRKSGKSQYMTDILKKHIDSKEICYFLVPEQSTLDTESKIISRLNSKGLLDVQVVSFKKLGNLLLKNSDLRLKTFLTEQGQLLILNKIINELDKKLIFFKRAKVSTLEEINRVIGSLRDLDQIDVSNEKISENHELQMKIKELTIIKEKYQEYLKAEYIDDIAFNEKLLETISQSAVLNNIHFFVDDFFAFSNQQIKIIKELMEKARSFTIALNIDVNNSEFNIIGQNIYQNLHEYSIKKHIVNKVTIMKNQYYASQELEHLENIVSNNKMVKFQLKSKDLLINSYTNIDEEIKSTFETIIRLVDQGYNYRDIKIICNNIDDYRNYFKLYRKLYEVPLFIDEKVYIHNHPISRLLISIINLLDDSKTEDIINLLKTGYLDFTMNEVELLEKYAKENGINYNKWHRSFNNTTEIEVTREKIYKLLIYFRKSILGSTIKEKITNLYEVLSALKVYDKLFDNIEGFKKEENFKNVYINTQFWNTLLEIFDQMVGFLGDKEISNNELQLLLKNSLEREFLSILPVNSNEVMVINSQDAFKESAEILFVIGGNEGFLPEKITHEPLFPLNEIMVLEEVLKWQKDDLSKQQIRNMELYFTLTLPNKKLYISYSLSDSKGDGIKPAYILKSIRSAFKLTNLDKNTAKHDKYFYSKKISLLNLIKLSKGGQIEISSKSFNSVFAEYGGFLDTLYQYNRIENNEGLIDREIVKKILFNDKEPFFTISKLEEYGKCPYSFFIKYGLNPIEEKEYEIKSMDIGNIYHNVLEKIGKKNWYLDNEENATDKIDEDFIMEYKENNLLRFDTHQLSYRLEKIKNEGLNLIEILRQDILKSNFKPTFYEMEFGPNKTFPEYRIELEDGGSLYLLGKVDRVDLLKADDKDYIRIIDYKLKGKKMDYRKFRDGIAFQLFVYLNALSGNKYIPAGVLYSRLIEDFNYDRLTGLIVKDKDQDLLVPEGFKENNSILPEEYALIRKFTEEKIKEHAKNILKGDFKVAPYYYKNDEKGCKYCKYLKICKNKKISRVLLNKKYDKKSFIEELINKYDKLD